QVNSGGTLTGAGVVTGNITGTGTITASGGTLDLVGSVASGSTLTIADVASSKLLIDGAATTAVAIAVDTSNKTLEIGAGHSLTVSGVAQAVSGSGTINLDSNTSPTRRSSDLQVNSGGTLTGAGVVTGN